MGKPAICSVLTTAAVQISQTLGFNKIQSMKNDTASVRNQKIWAFWVLYMMDKSLSLRFGRSSLIQDSDISVPEPELMVANQPTVVRLMAKWVKVSRIQGRVYDQLYSQSGLSEPSSVRASRANALASEIKSLIAANNDRQVSTFIPEFECQTLYIKCFFSEDYITHHMCQRYSKTNGIPSYSASH